MQNKTKIKEKSILRTIFTVAKWLVPLLIGVLLYRKFFHNSNFTLSHFTEQLLGIPTVYFLIMLVGACLNWVLETQKWRLLLQPFNPLSFRRALYSVLSGMAVAQLLPYKTGEYLGRMVYVRDRNKLNAALLSVIGSYSQLLVTVLFGIVGFMIVKPVPFTGYIIAVIALLLAAGAFFYFILPGMQFGTQWTLLLKIQSAFQLISRRELLRIALLSVLRYFTFLLPYALLAWHLGLSDHATLLFHLFAVSCIFFIQTLVPGFILTDIAFRMTIPLLVYSASDKAVTGLEYVPGMVIYLFNVALPMITGAILLLFTRFKPE